MDNKMQWTHMSIEAPPDGELVVFWVENNMQAVRGRFWIGRYIDGEVCIDKYMDHGITAGQYEATHWAKVVRPSDSRHQD